uniref:Uncharacterized protein n=1 Tax=Arundo donax TaxID=35708 RepID=A0A0A9E572_ARUDO
MERRLFPGPADQEPRPGPPFHRRHRQCAVPIQAGGRRAVPRAAPPPRGRRPPPGAVPRAAGAGGPSGLGEPAAARAVQVGRVPVRRRRRGRGEGRRLRQRCGQDAAQREEAGLPRADAGDGHADGGEVAQVTLLKAWHLANVDVPIFF